MKRKSIICSVVLSVILFVCVFEAKAQTDAEMTFIKENFNQGKKYYKNGLYNKAIPYFVTLAEKYPKNASFNYCTGMCYYYNSAIYDSAIYYLTKATSPVTSFYKMNHKAENAPTEAYYYLGMAYMRQSMPETAINHFNHYKKYLNPDIKAQRDIIADIDLQIDLCNREKEYFKKMRESRTVNQDSVQKVADHFKAQYMNILSVLEQRDHEIDQLKSELTTSNKAQIKPLSQLNTNDGEQFLYTIQIAATRRKVSSQEFKDIVGVKECLLSDGLYHYTKGEFKTRQEAEEACRKLWDLGYVNAWVRPMIPCVQ